MGGVNYSLNGKYTIGNSIFLEGVFSAVYRHESGDPATEIGRSEVLYRDYTTGTWSGGVGSNFDFSRHSIMGKITSTILLNNHTLDAGIEYKTNAANNIYDEHYITKYDSAYYYELIGKGFGQVQNRIPSLYIQDSWRIFYGLNISAGIRWDGHYIFGTNGQMVQKVSVPLQPYIGFVFLSDDKGDERIFGSFSRHSQEFAIYQSTKYHSDKGYNFGIFFDHDPRNENTGGDTVYNFPHVIRPEVNGLKGQYYDEFNLGYERLIGWNIKVGVQGLYRILREGIEDVWLSEENRYQYGNPGSGLLSEWPKPKREYAALIFTVERRNDEHFNFRVSYVLSRNYGNYEGLYDPFNHQIYPNQNSTFDDLYNARINAMGLLPNDRTHVFKLSGSYQFSFGLVAGISFIAQSGTPLSEISRTGFGFKFLSQRGTAGRTPAIWDLNARITYKLNFLNTYRTKLILDVLHIASQVMPVDINQIHYLNVDENGNPIQPNPNYGKAGRYQSPFSLRIGIEVDF